MLVSKISQKGEPVSARRTSAVSEGAKKQVEDVRAYLSKAVPDAQLDEDFLVRVASTYHLSRKNPSVLQAAVKQLQGADK